MIRGLIRTRGLGDIICALPIAQAWIEAGDQVIWPIDAASVPAFQRVEPRVDWRPVSRGEGYWLEMPQMILSQCNLDSETILYHSLEGMDIPYPPYHDQMRWDEWMYCVSGVPFARKWDLNVERDEAREALLIEKLDLHKPLILTHLQGSLIGVNAEFPREWTERYDIREISNLTDSPFDWLGAIELAEKIVFMDSFALNLADQLGIGCERHCIHKSGIHQGPVLGGLWIHH